MQTTESYSDAWERAEANGLLMNKVSRLVRADAMGFDIGTVYYKGMYPYDWNEETKDDPGPEITKIHRGTEFPAFSGDESGIYIAGFFTPDPRIANDFSMMTGSAGYPVFLEFI